METEYLHPELAREVGSPMPVKNYEIHPSLVAEVAEPVQELPESQDSSDALMAQSQEPVDQEVHEHEEAPAPVQESPKDRQWRNIRAKADEATQLAREKALLEEQLSFYKEQAQRQPVKEVVDEYETDSERQLRKQMKDVEARVAKAEREAAEARHQASISRSQQRLMQDYPDINEVVSDDNIARLKDEYPHLYNSVVASNDLYTVGAAAHEMIIAKGIYKKPINPLRQSTLVARNQAKPKSVSTIAPQQGDTPIAKAGMMMGNSISSEEEKKQIYKEMLIASGRAY